MEISAEVLGVVQSLALGGVIVGMLVALWVGAMALRNAAERDRQWQIVSYFVNMAEQTLIGQSGATKLDWVLTQLHGRFPKIDPTLVRAMIETAVREMNAQRLQ